MLKETQNCSDIFQTILSISHQQGLLLFLLLIFRKYLLNVANTHQPRSVAKAIFDIRKERMQQNLEEAPIVVTSEFAELLQDF